MSTIKTQDGTQIYYKDWGAGKPVLFSHGWPLDGDMWDSQLNFLAERGYRVIAFDRRGFGRSDQPRAFATDCAKTGRNLSAISPRRFMVLTPGRRFLKVC